MTVEDKVRQMQMSREKLKKKLKEILATKEKEYDDLAKKLSSRKEDLK